MCKVGPSCGKDPFGLGWFQCVTILIRGLLVSKVIHQTL